MTYTLQTILGEYNQTGATNYDAASSNCNWSAPKVVQERLQKRDILVNAQHFLDCAAGTGLLSERIRESSQQGTQITALDLSPDMLKKLEEKGIVDTLTAQNITEPWQVKRRSIDVAAGTGVGEYLTDAQLFKAIHRSREPLKKGGYLALTYRPEDGSGDGQKLHAPDTVEKIFNSAGFAIVEHLPFPAYTGDNGDKIHHQFILARKR